MAAPAFDPQLLLANLLNSETSQSEILQAFVTQLAAAGFPTTDWEDPGTILSILNVFAQQLASSNGAIASLAAAGFLDLAPGNPPGTATTALTNQTWLDLLAYSWFRQLRPVATQGVYQISVTVSASFGPYTISPNGLTIADPTGAFLYTSNNATSVTVTSASATTMQVQAQQQGTAYNSPIATPSTSMTVVTPLLGVTVTSSDVGTGTAVLTPGQNFGSDANLILACQTQWATLSPVSTIDAYIHYALTARDAAGGFASAVLVDATNPGGPGTCNIYLATQSGAASGPAGSNASVVSGAAPGNARVTGLTGMSATSDNYLAISGCASNFNNGVFPIVAVNSSTSVDVANPNAVIPDGNNGSIVWFTGLLASAQFLINQHVSVSGVTSVLTATADDIALAGTIYVPAAQLSNVETAFTSALSAFQANLGIGDGVSAGTVYLSEIYALVMNANAPNGPRNAESVTIHAIAADYVPAKGHIAVLSSSLVFSAV